jgi:hypothetical protein
LNVSIWIGLTRWPGTAAALLLASTCASLATAASTDAMSDVGVKAAFIYNFAKFTEWPALAPESPLYLCVVGDDRIAFALSAVSRGQTIQGHAIDIRRMPVEGGQPCHVLFVSQSTIRGASRLLDVLKGQPVLTVSDADDFASSGGMIGFLVEKGRMHFAINVDAIQRSQLHLSSRLLSLAKVVRDDRAR